MATELPGKAVLPVVAELLAPELKGKRNATLRKPEMLPPIELRTEDGTHEAAVQRG